MPLQRDENNAYLDTLARLEPDIAMIDPGAYYASAAISLKRLADAAEHQAISLKRMADQLCPALEVAAPPVQQ